MFSYKIELIKNTVVGMSPRLQNLSFIPSSTVEYAIANLQDTLIREAEQQLQNKYDIHNYVLPLWLAHHLTNNRVPEPSTATALEQSAKLEKVNAFLESTPDGIWEANYKELYFSEENSIDKEPSVVVNATLYVKK